MVLVFVVQCTSIKDSWGYRSSKTLVPSACQKKVKVFVPKEDDPACKSSPLKRLYEKDILIKYMPVICMQI